MLEPLTAKRVRLVGLDVDGVLTDAGVYVGIVNGQPAELKRFDIQDGIGIHLMLIAGLKVVLVSGRLSEATRLYAEEWGVDDLAQDDRGRKLSAFERLLSKFGVRIEDAAFMGDDLPDVPVLRRVGLPVAVANATPDVMGIVQHVTAAAGGHGAVREFVEELLRARGQWESVLQTYFEQRGDRSPGIGRAITR